MSGSARGSIANDGLAAVVRPLPGELRRLAAEVVGTFGLVFFGAGRRRWTSRRTGRLGRVGVGLTFGLAVGAMVLAFGRVSGAHINPAVTVGLWESGAVARAGGDRVVLRGPLDLLSGAGAGGDPGGGVASADAGPGGRSTSEVEPRLVITKFDGKGVGVGRGVRAE